MHKKLSLAVLSLSLTFLFGAFSGPAAASEAVIKKAEELMRQGRPADAFKLLEPLESKSAGNVDYDYLLGISALDSRNFERALIAFERVLAVNPAHLGARLDLGRTYFALGSLDLAKQEFERVRAANPPPAARKVVDDHLAAIEERQRADRRRLTAYLEAGVGYDDNITSVTTAFQGGTQQAFGAAFNPTGNAIKRRAGFLALGGGVDFVGALSERFAFMAGFDARGRYFDPKSAPIEPAPRPVAGDFPRNNSAYDSETLDGRVGLSMRVDPRTVANLVLRRQQFRQDGDTPINPGQSRTTADRDTDAIGYDVRFALSSEAQLGLFVQYANNRFKTLDTQDTNQVTYGLGYLHAFQRRGNPLIFLSVFNSEDYARRPQNPPLNTTDVSKRVRGLRAYGQYSVTERTDVSLGLGYSRRDDQTAFSRSTLIRFGEDDTYEASVGVTWRFAPLWSVRGVVSHTNNDSNLSLYSFKRTESSVFVRREFR
jgi:tetratricopeptide (TPR) repeat protein